MSKAIIKQLGAVGWVPDAQPYDLPPNAWSNVTNVRFRNEYAERLRGTTPIGVGHSTSSYKPDFLMHYASGSTNYIVMASLDSVYISDGTTTTDITGPALGALDPTIWSGGVMFGVLGLNNQQDAPMFWAGNLASNLAVFTGWSANWRCKVLRPFKNYWVALNITKSGTNYPHMVKWSHAASPGAAPSSWDETDTTLTAGESNLDGTDIIIDALPMGDTLIIYKQRSIWSMRYIGAPLVFSFQRLPLPFGVQAINCVAEFPGGHAVFTNRDVIVHDGQTYRSVLEGRAKDWLQQNIYSIYEGTSFVAANTPKKEIWTFIPIEATGFGATAGAAIIWNWENNTLSKWNATYPGGPGVKHACVARVGAKLLPWNGAVTNETYSGKWQDAYRPWDGDVDQINSSGLDSNRNAMTALPTDREFMIGCKGAAANQAENLMVFDLGFYNDWALMSPAMYRTGIALDDKDSRFMVRAMWPRIDGDTGLVISASIGSVEDAATDVSNRTTTGYTIGTSKKVNFTGSGRFVEIGFAEATTGSIYAGDWRIGTNVIDVEKLGQY